MPPQPFLPPLKLESWLHVQIVVVFSERVAGGHGLLVVLGMTTLMQTVMVCKASYKERVQLKRDSEPHLAQFSFTA